MTYSGVVTWSTRLVMAGAGLEFHVGVLEVVAVLVAIVIVTTVAWVRFFRKSGEK